MPQNEDTRGTNNPEEGAKRRSVPKERNANDKEASIQVLLGDGMFTELSRVGR
jgi:hypothetical protein